MTPLQRQKIDEHIRQMWVLFYDATNDSKIDHITDADMDIWMAVTKHPAVQDRLERAANGRT